MKCCIIAIYQYKNIEQKEFSRIVLFRASARFENFATYCKGNVKEMVTSSLLVTKLRLREFFENCARSQ